MAKNDNKPQVSPEDSAPPAPPAAPSSSLTLKVAPGCTFSFGRGLVGGGEVVTVKDFLGSGSDEAAAEEQIKLHLEAKLLVLE